MAVRTLEDAMADRQGASYIAHLVGHAKNIMACYDRVKAKAKSNPGAAKRLAEYDATLERYEREVKMWAVLHPETEG